MIARYLTVLLLVLIVSSSGVAQTILRNLVENPSFEYTGRDTVRKQPDEAWSFNTDSQRVTGHVTTSRAIDGFRSFLIRADEGRGYLESNTFGIDRRERYLFSYGVCGNGAVETTIMWWHEEDDSLTLLDIEYLERKIVSDNWEVSQFQVNSPRRATAASVRFTISNGQVWIDDVRFRERPY